MEMIRQNEYGKENSGEEAISLKLLQSLCLKVIIVIIMLPHKSKQLSIESREKTTIGSRGTSRSIPNVSQPLLSFSSPTLEGQGSLLSKSYGLQVRQMREKIAQKTRQRLLRLDFIIRNTRQLNNILGGKNSPQSDQQNQEKCKRCNTHR